MVGQRKKKPGRPESPVKRPGGLFLPCIHVIRTVRLQPVRFKSYGFSGSGEFDHHPHEDIVAHDPIDDVAA